MNVKALSLFSLIEIYEKSVDEVLKDINKGNKENDFYERNLMKLFSQALLYQLLENLKNKN